jgi:hypothetical protein
MESLLTQAFKDGNFEEMEQNQYF